MLLSQTAETLDSVTKLAQVADSLSILTMLFIVIVVLLVIVIVTLRNQRIASGADDTNILKLIENQDKMLETQNKNTAAFHDATQAYSLALQNADKNNMRFQRWLELHEDNANRRNEQLADVIQIQHGITRKLIEDNLKNRNVIDNQSNTGV